MPLPSLTTSFTLTTITVHGPPPPAPGDVATCLLHVSLHPLGYLAEDAQTSGGDPATDLHRRSTGHDVLQGVPRVAHTAHTDDWDIDIVMQVEHAAQPHRLDRRARQATVRFDSTGWRNSTEIAMAFTVLMATTPSPPAPSTAFATSMRRWVLGVSLENTGTLSPT